MYAAVGPVYVYVYMAAGPFMFLCFVFVFVFVSWFTVAVHGGRRPPPAGAVHGVPR